MNTTTGTKVAPHGIMYLALLALLLIAAVHMMGFRVMAAVKVG